MSCSIHARVFLVALCLLSVSIVLESLLARDLSRQFTSCAFHRSSPPQRINTSRSAILFDAPIETDNYTSVLLRAILDSPHSWELIVKGVLRSFTFWAVVGVTTLFHHVDQPDPGLPTISCFATQVSSAIYICVRVALPAPVTFMPTRVVPPRLLATVSSASLSLPSKRHFPGRGRSPSRVAEITF